MTTKIFALGDSWYHYPKGLDRNGNVVLFPNLENVSKGVGIGNIPFYLNRKFAVDINYRETTLSEAWDASRTDDDYSNDDDLGACGEELLVMVYGKSRQKPDVVVNATPWLGRLIERIKYYNNAVTVDRAIILISGGGNDMVDKNLPDFLDFANGKPKLKEPAFTDALENYLKKAFLKIFEDLVAAFPKTQFQFVFHGYDYPPVNGRGLINHNAFILERPLQSLTPGPWLTPAFNNVYHNAGLPLNRADCEAVIDEMIDRFNTMLATLANGTDKYYIDLRNTADRNNRDADWCNELHYDRDRFIAASATYYKVITGIIMNGV